MSGYDAAALDDAPTPLLRSWFLAKPFPASELNSTVRTILEG
jgi:hypothetical protein